jgi:transposase
LDLGDRTSHYCILDEAGKVILEHRLPTTPQGIQQVFSRIPCSRMALETGTHSPWVSRQLTQLGHEVIAAHARNVRLIGESSRKDDQLDARMLARLARIDPELLGPVRHRSARAQIHHGFGAVAEAGVKASRRASRSFVKVESKSRATMATMEGD